MLVLKILVWSVRIIDAVVLETDFSYGYSGGEGRIMSNHSSKGLYIWIEERIKWQEKNLIKA